MRRPGRLTRSMRSITGLPSKHFKSTVKVSCPSPGTGRKSAMEPPVLNTLRTAFFSFEEARCTSGLPADWPFLMRVRRSAMGSVILMRCSSPARLDETRNFAAIGDFADLHARQPELAVHAARTAGDRAAVALPRGARVARHRLQLRLRRLPLLVSGLRAADQLLELRTLHRVLLHDLCATLLALDHVGFRHSLRKSSLFAEREAERFQQRSALFVVDRRRRNRDVHAAQLIDLVVLDLREDDLLFDSEAVIAAAVKGARRHAAKIADARNGDADQAIQEFVHARAAQRHLAPHSQALAQLEGRDRLLRFAHERLLP